MKITVLTVVAAPIAVVWRAYNSPQAIKLWNTASPQWHTTAASIDLRVGGKFSFRMEANDGSAGFDFAGEYLDVIAHQLLEYRFGERVGKVEFAEGPAGVTVKVTFDSEASNSEEQQRLGWQAILDNFRRHVESLPRLTQAPAALLSVAGEEDPGAAMDASEPKAAGPQDRQPNVKELPQQGAIAAALRCRTA
ncbi:MAG: SRPBCC domain-containing protein [Chitinophagaceae bacterium]|nr:SRPBCC domain-containing protein [Rubrivivax sp.]